MKRDHVDVVWGRVLCRHASARSVSEDIFGTGTESSTTVLGSWRSWRQRYALTSSRDHTGCLAG